MIEPRHIGDGVYASFDGYQIWLGLRPGQQMIALDDYTFAGLLEYQRDLVARVKAAMTAAAPADNKPAPDSEEDIRRLFENDALGAKYRDKPESGA